MTLSLVRYQRSSDAQSIGRFSTSGSTCLRDKMMVLRTSSVIGVKRPAGAAISQQLEVPPSGVLRPSQQLLSAKRQRLEIPNGLARRHVCNAMALSDVDCTKAMTNEMTRTTHDGNGAGDFRFRYGNDDWSTVRDVRF